ncbi:thiamine phosphate synthase [Erythrobacteraceae bacterium CFH 75059]|uniref:thiamine phosphate synthase n=1 Tax=Qipengyuania thermophila TaxID=2509361 RepID=UPI001020543A|nr:thiamine phosphate synthase [Qipengyuania thermophila]TCD05081.1 thiamine phosphate synthase [Erythrobacteraceae bacterium CFH 75059]
MVDAPRIPCQLYLVSPQEVAGEFPARLEQALSSGAGLVTAFQFRVKGLDDEQAAQLAAPLLDLCRAHDCAFIVNDSPTLAHRLGADGVHLGQGDGDVRSARALLGPRAQIGVTCHGSRHLAMDAGEQGADYVAFGSFFPSRTKASEHRAEPAILDWWSRLFELPCVAIGGITPANCGPLVAAGADFLAVSHSVWSAPDVAAAVADFRTAMAMEHPADVGG